VNDLHQDFASFCRLVLDGKEANGAALAALLEAYLKLSSGTRRLVPGRPPTLDYGQPFQVYEIRNNRTGRTYVGRAAAGFGARYPKGLWWEGHHNEALNTDILLHGLGALSVQVFQCADVQDMCLLERMMYDAAELRYNEAVPPDVP
jgi:hypothetical protein